jgi:hypothetical protein
MGLQIHPERRRRLMELARLHRQWQQRHGVDESDPDDAARRPTPAQEREFTARARRVMGLDPETGHYRS